MSSDKQRALFYSALSNKNVRKKTGLSVKTAKKFIKDSGDPLPKKKG